MRSRLFLLSLVPLAFAFACSSASSTAPAETKGADAGPPLPALGMNDVSILMPIPTTSSAPGYLRPKDEGAKGPLLPQAVYDAIPQFGVQPADGLDYALMRAIAVRFDGCFPGPAGCEAQIRLVMQPIEKGNALDSALHLFYRLTEDELREVVLELRRLRTLAPEVQDAPLDVHAAIVAQGADGEYGMALRDLVLAYAGEQNFTRMTFFLRAPPIQEEWFFGGFNRVDGKLVQLDIVGVGKQNQRVNRPATTEGFTYTFTPAGNKPEDVSALLSTETAKTSPAEAVQAALGAFVRIENPTKYGPDALPCAGCHVSTVVTDHAKNVLGLDPDAHPDAFKSTRDLTVRGDAPKTPSSLRAFGWFEKRAMIGKRIVNETAAVVDDLEARFPATKP